MRIFVGAGLFVAGILATIGAQQIVTQIPSHGKCSWEEKEARSEALTGNKLIAYLFPCNGLSLGMKIHMGETGDYISSVGGKDYALLQAVGFQIQTAAGDTNNCAIWTYSLKNRRAHFRGIADCGLIR
ncbi:hypothetical protein A2765_06115 [Candidatus Kaiserbacteria bacterium RIFCSPHIGHO2_01_FULL_56_24]|uniref:Uncharacterized protein n=1 Tax=Candidatus Kaiserbacteria bacterium RIFCSPHIGHO2_01_FULL_56_24 TaxID=1798487 RepID=A0A1F6D8I5_9BACT|nr:MAG: hypothetical protein A2765_06115 [Candidatus Kaiserbacteria bacterium RIFCSPHIGHO2_01_FULL_56_24]